MSVRPGDIFASSPKARRLNSGSFEFASCPDFGISFGSRFRFGLLDCAAALALFAGAPRRSTLGRWSIRTRPKAVEGCRSPSRLRVFLREGVGRTLEGAATLGGCCLECG